MPQFKYLARKSDGKLMDGVLTCSDRAAAIFQVERAGGVPIRIEAVPGGEPTAKSSPASTGAPRRAEATKEAGPLAKPVADVVALGAAASLSHAMPQLGDSEHLRKVCDRNTCGP